MISPPLSSPERSLYNMPVSPTIVFIGAQQQLLIQSSSGMPRDSALRKKGGYEDGI
jgi:hypothetical protein